MKTTVEFLDAVRQRHNLTSDYQLAQFLAISRERVSRYRRRGDFLGEVNALRVAAALDLKPGYVLACVAAERAKSDEVKAVWRNVAATAAVVVVALALAQLEYRGALLTVSAEPSLYIMSNAAFVILAALALLAAIREKRHIRQ